MYLVLFLVQFAYCSDIIVIPEEGFSSSPPPRRNTLFRSTGWASGCHERDGILAVSGPGIQAGSAAGPKIEDIAPTVLHLMNLPVPQDMDGRVLEELLDPKLRSVGNATVRSARRDERTWRP